MDDRFLYALGKQIEDFELINGDSLKEIILLGEKQGVRRLTVSEML